MHGQTTDESAAYRALCSIECVHEFVVGVLGMVRASMCLRKNNSNQVINDSGSIGSVNEDHWP